MPPMSNVILGMEGYWMDVNSGMLLSSLVNAEKNCTPNTSALEDTVVFQLLFTSSGDNFMRSFSSEQNLLRLFVKESSNKW